jgi:hypothetical protein
MNIDEAARIIAILTFLKRGDCWCEVAINNPMVTEHSRGCIEAKKLYEEIKKEVDKINVST